MTSFLKLLAGNFRGIGATYWPSYRPFTTVPTPRYTHALNYYNDAQLLRVEVVRTELPYLSLPVMAHLQHHLPHLTGFQTKLRTYVETYYSPIFDGLDLSSVGSTFQVEEVLQQRDILMQTFEACPAGSYGYYAQYGLAPFKAVVGSFAAASIHEFFASQAHFLKQPMSDGLNEIMSTMETKYWDSREKFIEWLAGKFLTKGGRRLGVQVPATLLTLWEGKHKPQLPPGEELESVQLEEANRVLRENIDTLDVEVLQKFGSDLYDQLVKEGHITTKKQPGSEE